ncbi:MAG: hypothetical protein GX558_09780 [Clostridiales bacterium]|nr:hypothetical protein [Clostridiales bacterium]
MASYRFPHARRLHQAIEQRAGAEVAAQITGDDPGPTPGDARKAEWAEAACLRLIDRFSPEEVAAIRIDCACGPAEGRMKALKRHYQSHGTLASIAEKFSAEGGPSWVENGVLYVSYPACYCSCVKRAPGPLPRAWCLCSVGYTRRNLEYALGRPVKVTLLESVKTGGARCLMKAEVVGDDV